MYGVAVLAEGPGQGGLPWVPADDPEIQTFPHRRSLQSVCWVILCGRGEGGEGDQVSLSCIFVICLL